MIWSLRLLLIMLGGWHFKHMLLEIMMRVIIHWIVPILLNLWKFWHLMMNKLSILYLIMLNNCSQYHIQKQISYILAKLSKKIHWEINDEKYLIKVENGSRSTRMEIDLKFVDRESGEQDWLFFVFFIF